MNLTEKQKRFADYYIETGNATEAYRRAGYTSKGKAAEANASRLIRNDKVQKYIDERNSALESDRIASMKEVKEFWSEIMRSELQETKDRLKASEMIAKTNAAFIDKIEHSGETTQNIKNESDLSRLSVKELKQLESILSKTAEPS